MVWYYVFIFFLLYSVSVSVNLNLLDLVVHPRVSMRPTDPKHKFDSGKPEFPFSLSRCWLLPVMRELVCPPLCVYSLRSLIWGLLLQPLCPEQEYCMSTHRTLAGARKTKTHTKFKIFVSHFSVWLGQQLFLYCILSYVTSWIDTRQAQSERANLTILFDKYVPYCLEQVRCNLKTITPIPESSMVQVRTSIKQ